MKPTECADNDSPWLICKHCATSGKCTIADQLREAQAKVLREAAEACPGYAKASNLREYIRRMAAELESKK